jgi:hypothetical protein
VSVIVAIADLVAAELTAASASGTLPETFTAERVFRPVTKLEDAQQLRVLVAPTGIERQLAARTSVQRDYEVQVGVLRRVGDDEAFTDALALCEAIEELFLGPSRPALDLEGDSHAAVIAVDTSPLYSPEASDQDGVFLSVISLTCRVVS